MLYQLIIGTLDRPLATGWQDDIQDELLRSDVLGCVERDPDKRFSSAAELAERLETLENRRRSIDAMRLAEARRRESERMAQIHRRRNRLLTVAFAVAACFLIMASGFGAITYFLWQEAEEQRSTAEGERLNATTAARYARQAQAKAEHALEVAKSEADRADSTSTFIIHMLQILDDPSNLGDRSKVSLFLEHTAKGITKRFQNQPDVASRALHRLGTTAWELGYYELAEQQLTASMKLAGDVFGQEHLYTLMAQNNLANVWLSQGKIEQAEVMYLKTLETQRRTLGNTHPNTFQSANNVAATLIRKGDVDNGLEFLEDTLQSQKDALPNEHRQLLLTMYNLGIAYELKGWFKKARVILEKARDGFVIKGQSRNADAIARVQAELGERDAAVSILRANLKDKISLLGSRHPDVAVTLLDLAEVLILDGHRDEAIQYAQKASHIFTVVLGADHQQSRMAEDFVNKLKENTDQDDVKQKMVKPKTKDPLDKLRIKWQPRRRGVPRIRASGAVR
jgi:tetratricopeptide (TPR) repeat protein